MSLYAHNQTLLKDTGDWVSSNGVIATLGNSGGQTREGLYFEIRHNGKPQNPKSWLAARK
jgi:septal ring factor EnvC (AmiA/AmiB activator)